MTLPKDAQLSSPPLTGKFQIRCPLSDGTFNNTQDISLDVNSYFLYNVIVAACPNFFEKITVTVGGMFSSPSDGMDIYIRMAGLNQDVPLFQPISSTKYPMQGN